MLPFGIRRKRIEKMSAQVRRHVLKTGRKARKSHVNNAETRGKAFLGESQSWSPFIVSRDKGKESQHGAVLFLLR